MSSYSLTLFFFFFFFNFTFLFTFSNSFNITDILSKKSDFSTFNELLTETQLAATINNRQTITVLVVSNDALSSVSSYSSDELKNILSLHVILDYYDVTKLKNLNNKTTILTTLLQSSGLARGQQGFLNATVKTNGDIVFGSAVPGSILNARLIESVVQEPFNISVLHISSAIPVMIDPPNASPYVAKAPLPAQPPNDDAYPSDPDDAPSPPASSPNAPSHKKADAPSHKKADAPPADAESPSHKAASSPPPADAEAPSHKADAPPADAVAPSHKADDAEAPSHKADSTTSGVSRNVSDLHLPFTLVMSAIWLFVMT